jgi:hypothetical protein
MNCLIAAAIEQRRLLKLVYSVGSRIVEPQIHGLTGCGKVLLRCYQVAGESASRERAGWKLFRARDVDAVEVLDVRFVSGDMKFWTAHCRTLIATGRSCCLRALCGGRRLLGAEHPPEPASRLDWVACP